MSSGPSAGASNVPTAPMHDKIPLPQLIEAAVQKTYHELYTMADVYVFDVFSLTSHPFELFSLQSKSNLDR